MVGIIFSIVILRIGYRRHGDNYYTTPHIKSRALAFRMTGKPPAAGHVEFARTLSRTATGAESEIEIYVHESTASKVDHAEGHELRSFRMVTGADVGAAV